MNPSALFIARPVGTILLAIGLVIVGIAAYFAMPVASLPAIEFPTIRVMATRPGADPETMAATIAAPIERRLGEIAGVTELTSQSNFGTTGITVQFDLSRKIDGAARDVQAALNAAATDLPSDLPTAPVFRKFNPSAAPIMILALTSDQLPAGAIYDAADTVIAPRISQVSGIADVSVSGADQPAIRVRVDPSRLATMGLSLADVRKAIADSTNVTPLGAIDGEARTFTLAANDQLRTPESYRSIVVRVVGSTVVQLGDVARIDHAVAVDVSIEVLVQGVEVVDVHSAVAVDVGVGGDLRREQRVEDELVLVVDDAVAVEVVEVLAAGCALRRVHALKECVEGALVDDAVFAEVPAGELGLEGRPVGLGDL
jgi:multidrug efflux pump